MKAKTADEAYTKTMLRLPKKTLLTLFEEVKMKAAKYDELHNKIDKCYEMDDKGEFIDKNADLCTIGEITASHFGYI